MGHVRQGLFTAACMLACQTGWAQGWHGSPHPYTDPNLNYAPIPGTAAYEPMYAPQHGYSDQGVSTLSPEMRYHLLPADRGFLYDQDSRLDLVLKEHFRGSWFSVEYLNWTIDQTSDTLIGAPTNLTVPTQNPPRNPTLPFTIPTNDPTGVVTREAIVDDTGGADWSDINGIKGALGIPLTQHAWIEGSFWGLEETTDALDVTPLPKIPTAGDLTPVQLVLVPLLTNGQVGTTVIAYDNSFDASYRTQVWSADANLVFDHLGEDLGWRLQSIWGFRHIEYGEKFGFTGSFTNISGYDQVNPAVIPPVSDVVLSDVDNYLYGGQLGWRSEYRHKYFTVGSEPKFLFAGNFQRGSVLTNNLRDPGNISGVPINDPLMVTSYQSWHFSPAIDWNISIKLHATSWMNVKVGYNFLWVAGLATADRSIYYNDNGASNPPAVVVQEKTTDRFIDGLTIGAEFLLP